MIHFSFSLRKLHFDFFSETLTAKAYEMALQRRKQQSNLPPGNRPGLLVQAQDALQTQGYVCRWCLSFFPDTADVIIFCTFVNYKIVVFGWRTSYMLRNKLILSICCVTSDIQYSVWILEMVRFLIFDLNSQSCFSNNLKTFR